MHLYANFDGLRNCVIPYIDDELHMSDALSDSLNSFYQMCVMELDPRAGQVAQLVERVGKIRDKIRARHDALQSATESLSGTVSELDDKLWDLYETARHLDAQ